MFVVSKSDFIASIVLFLIGVIFYFIIIPQEIVLEDEAVLGPDLLPNICILLIIFLSALLFFKSISKDKPNNKGVKDTDIKDAETNFASLINIRSGFTLIEIRRVFFLLTTILTSILLFIYVDVLLASIFLIIGSCIVCGLKKIWIIGSLSFSLIILAYFLLYKVLGTAIG